jgi:hypothetical protein
MGRLFRHACGMGNAQSRFHPYMEIIDWNTVQDTDVCVIQFCSMKVRLGTLLSIPTVFIN